MNSQTQVLFGYQITDVQLTREVMGIWNIPKDAKKARIKFSNGEEIISKIRLSYSKGNKVIMPRFFYENNTINKKVTIVNISNNDLN